MFLYTEFPNLETFNYTTFFSHELFFHKCLESEALRLPLVLFD